MVDASVGGKTGINFNGLKNEIGVFSEAHTVILSTLFLKTLDRENILSGYAEMLKHSLIADEATWSETLLLADSLPLTDSRCDYQSRQAADECSDRNNQSEQSVINASQFSALSSQLKKSVEVKERIVTEDPKETGLRKALNLGHTAGHAFESFAMQQGRPVLHGYAVAYGLVCELWLSAVKCGFPTEKLRQIVSLIRENYGQMAITCDDYPALINLMRHDKKNRDGIINFTLLSDIGDIRINQSVTDEDIRQSLDFYREG
jgi:3-dehydroquinate synthase